MPTCDAVVGLGAHGSSAAYHLSRQGQRVLGLERFARGHALGSSGGLSRVIRVACSGHGFKFATVIGEIPAELSVRGRSHPIDFFSAARLSGRA